MVFATQILFFFGAIGVFNSLLVSLYFLISKSRSSFSNRIFGWFLLVLSLRVLKSVFYSFSTEEPIFFLQSGPAFFLLIGPLLLTYVASVLNLTHAAVQHWKPHVILWGSIALGLYLFVPFPQNVMLNKEILLPIINVQWLLYTGMVGWLLYSNSNHFSRADLLWKWILFLLLAVLTIWSVFFFASFQYFISGSIVFSCLFYSCYGYFIFHKKSASSIFKEIKNSSTSSSNPKIARLIEQLNDLMVTEKPYTNQSLKSADVAQQLNLSTHELSRLVNEHLGRSFTDFINEYRVEEAKRLITTNSRYTIEAIGNQAGFNSKSAFYKAFKKFHGTTPGQFLG